MSVHNAAEFDTNKPDPRPQLSVVPERPIFTPFDRDSLTELAITHRIAEIVADIKNEPSKVVVKPDESKDISTDNKEGSKPPKVDYETARGNKRRETAIKIFQKFHMLDETAVTDFTDMYNDAEKTALYPDTDVRRELVSKVGALIEHPVIRTTVALSQESGVYIEGIKDAVIVQRTAAVLLESVEPAGIWE